MTDPIPPTSASPPLVEGIDYAVEAGRWVFLRAYLLRRGVCCGNGCRHCPYRAADETTAADPSENPNPRVDRPVKS